LGAGIIVCGLNGSGKSTLGKALADALGFHFIDIEDLFFPKSSLDYLYANPRSRDEVERMLLTEVKTFENFVFAAVKGDYGAEILSLFTYAVLISIPKEIRMKRVRERSYLKFGKRMLPGGDLYDREEAFFNMVASRTEQYVEDWVNSLQCDIIRVGGTKHVAENLPIIIKRITG